jgi:group I intron endonuclease
MQQIKGKCIDINSKYPGVYVIVNLKNNKFYIGSSVNLYNRKSHHFSFLKKNKHANRYLQRAWNKDSKYFIMLELEKVEDRNNVYDREQWWLDELTPYDNSIGYNLSHTATGNNGIKRTPETCAKLSKAKKGTTHTTSEETKRKISESNTGKVRSEETKQKLREINLGKTLSEEHKQKIGESSRKSLSNPKIIEKMRKDNPNNKKVYQYDLGGNLLNSFESCAEAGRQLGLKKENISRVCRGERKKYHGFIWSYEELNNT